ncbi:hypothetical protein J437_LFUL002874 [Ladona fulva]|uniref:Reverse transcriptase/retrotransposon-derived protein RNase H-like domain-containing protein n=1 Tax=Ladona fulva TaxID=123851 RepID=A0A8K0P9T8_LADFU|nr:hypothetical protein J437_LFUL002874 [Ladona fulva]
MEKVDPATTQTEWAMPTATVVPYDETRPLELAYDLSECRVGAVLFHTMAIGQDRPVTYASQTLTEAERHYAPIDQEALASGVWNWKVPQLFLIFGEKWDLPKITRNQLHHWALYLNQYNRKREYQPGKENQCADALPQLPMPTTMRLSRECKFVNLVMGGKVGDLALPTKIL